MKNALLFIFSTNILVRLLTVNIKNSLSPKNLKMCDPIIVNPVVKMRPHPAAHPQPHVGKYPPPSAETCRLGSWLFYWGVIEEKSQAINHKKKGKHSSRLFLSRLGRTLTKPFTNSPKKLRPTKFTYFF